MNTPFDTIESAQEFLGLLREAVDEAKHNADADIVAEGDLRSPRRIDAVRLVVYKLEKLEQHIKASCRLLNDLRTLRRLLLEERSESAVDRHEVETVQTKVQPPVELPKNSAAAKPRAVAI
jgi:hypothetical protein